MKKIILSLLLFSSFLFADSKAYFGLAYGTVEENFKTANATSSSPEALNIKFGYGIRKAYAIEVSLEYVANESKIFSTGDAEFDGDKYSMNIELVKSFDLDIYILPYLKAGFGTGIMKIDRVLDDSLSFGSFNLGTGIFISINDNLDFEIEYKYKSFSYEGLDLIASSITHTSFSHSAYFGLNIRY